MVKKYFIVFAVLIAFAFSEEYSGLRNSDGQPHELHKPHLTTGDTLNILDFGADPLDNEHDDQAAFDLAYAQADPGDEIYFPAGHYNFNKASIYKNTAHYRMKSEINIRGASRDSVFFISNFPDDINETLSTMFFYGSGVNDIVIQGITFTSTYKGIMPTSLVENNPDKTSPMYGIFLCDNGAWRPSYNITVRDCAFELIRRMMIRVESSHDIVIKNTVFLNATDLGGGGAGYGVSIQGDGHEIYLDGYPADCMYNLVDSCSFLGPYIRHGVIIQYTAHNNAVRNSYFYKSGYDAIDLHGEDEYLNEIYNNTVEDVPTGAGVGLGNTGATHDASGRKNYIHDNTFNRCREGVKVMLKSPETLIENNESNYCTRGVYILNGPKTRIMNNASNNCSYGILLEYDAGTLGAYNGNPDSVIISGNYLFDNTWGLKISAGTNIMLGENFYQNNAVADTVFAEGVTFIPYSDVAVRNVAQAAFQMAPAYPNPFNNSTVLNFKLSDALMMDISIVDINGKFVEDIFKGRAEKGTYKMKWNAERYPAGIYILKLVVGNKILTQKLLYLK